MKLFKPILLVCFALFMTLGFYAILSFFERQKPPPEPIRAIAQTGPLKEALKTDCLAELLGLSLDRPHAISSEEAEALLKKHPVIQKASVSLLNPETLYIDYTLRTPQFILGDVENLAIDREGKAFPLSPFFSPKNLPTLYLGKGNHGEKKKVASHLFKILGDETTLIDVSQAFEPSLGKRELIAFYGPHILRLTPKRYSEELERYRKIKERLGEEPMIIDLRVEHLAYIINRGD